MNYFKLLHLKLKKLYRKTSSMENKGAAEIYEHAFFVFE